MSPSVFQGNGDESQRPTLEPIAICGMACRLPGGIDSDASLWEMLVNKRSGQTPKVPASRFNIDAHLHQNPERPGSFNVPGGYFLDGRPEDFDPTFFNMTPIEAQWLDPQQRKMLEVSYECLVSAGLTLDAVAGSNTAVFVGSFTADYQQMSTRDPDFRHNYAATGVDPGIISNRIGNTFNLNGPSFTINTACSSSVYAIHNACHALRARDCDAAIAGGVNLIITVDQHMNTAKLGILSPTSTCHTFDASADGYGRAEGAGALYLKRLSDAIRDDDPIRAVIRSTAVNTNGKVEGMGITHPSGKGQERVVRMAYAKANLDPNETIYAELHGTGTPVGDPIEVKAIGRALNDTRPRDRPLFMGAIKPNIGHSEAASGIFAVMKAALMTEAGVIPGVAGFRKLNPEILEDEWNVKVHSETAPWPADSLVRRASVSSFGYGGTNGHVIVESVDSLHPRYQHARQKSVAHYDHSSDKPYLLCFSAHDKATLSRNIKAIGDVAAKYYAADLAHTLNLHRTKFAHRAFAIMREGQEADCFNPASMPSGVVPKTKGKLGFLFTGQGAQWVGMGKIAFMEFPIFRETIEKLDLVMHRVTPKPSFRIADLLLDDAGTTASRINDAEVTQPLCTAIQIALVDLFSQWDITPAVSIGHSSGEIGAAYAAGLISGPEAMIAAFCRGRAVKEASTSGSMLAVGLGAEEVQQFLSSDLEDVCIACENSPSSVTLSGKTKCISQLREELSAKGVFARELKTGKAYHSPHMAPVGDAYDIILSRALSTLTEDDFLWRKTRSRMISSVTGEPIVEDTLPASYWSANLKQRVLFNTAVQRLGSDEDFNNVSCMVEIGPHSALSGPFKQICIANKFDKLSYIPSLVRNKNDADQLLSVAGSLFNAGLSVDLEEVNWDEKLEASRNRKSKTQYLLVDLPPYQWNYDKRYWAEPRGSAEQRNRAYPRHDVLGSRVAGLSDGAKIWRNILRHRDLPWLKDHNLGGTAIFPAAGYLSIAIEALRQVHETEGLAFEGTTLRDVDIKTALVVPDNDEVEIIATLRPIGESGWHTFTIESLAEGKWSSHCEGRITARGKPAVKGSHPVDESVLSRRASGKTWYDAFHRVGFNYTNTFQQLQEARTDDFHHASGDVSVVDKSGVVEGESRYLIHPATIDACLQLIIISIHAGKHKEMPWGVVPTAIEEVSLFFPGDDIDSTGRAVAWTDGFDGRKFNTHTRLMGPSGKLLMNIKSLVCVSYEAALLAESRSLGLAETFSVATWKQDVASLSAQNAASTAQVKSVDRMVEIIHHREPVKNALVLGVPSSDAVENILRLVPDNCAVTVAFAGEQETNLAEDVLARVAAKVLSPSPEAWQEELEEGQQDLVLVDFSGTQNSKPGLSPSVLLPLLQKDGWLLGSPQDFATLPGSALKIGDQFALPSSDATKHNGSFGSITVLTATTSSSGVAGILSSTGSVVREKAIAEYDSSEDTHVIVDDTTGVLLSSLNQEEFQTLKAVLGSGSPTLWLTKGVKAGQSAVGGGLAEGFLRAVRSEQAASRVALLDFTPDEKAHDLAQTIIAKLASAETKDSGRDTEFWLHEGAVYIPRVYPHTELNQKWCDTPQTSDMELKPLPKHQPLKVVAHGDGVVFRPTSQQAVLAADEIKVQVEASEYLPTSGSHMIVSGTIAQAGSSRDQSIVGKRVVAFSNDGLSTIVRTPAYAVADGELESQLPTSLIAALSPLNTIAGAYVAGGKMGAGSRILSLPGPKTIMNMTVLLARAHGWDLTLVVDREQDREQIMSTSGVDANKVLLSSDLDSVIAAVDSLQSSPPLTVIAHDFSPLSQEVWRNIPALGRFLLVTRDGSMKQGPDGLPFSRGASFIPVISKTLHATSESASSLLKTSLDLVERYPELLSASDSAKIVDASDLRAVKADNGDQDAETTVVNLRYEESQVVIPPEAPSLSLSPDSSYLLVGCLGGLGRSLTKWMIERGAKHFVFLSRSGADKPEAARVVAEITDKGASARVFRADASDEEAVRQIVGEVNKERPIRGVVHAAMVLKDGILEQMDYASFMAAVAPKAKGALSLHKALGGAELDFFVMTSSISAVLGNTGQSNYSAGNSFLDSLALHRNIRGLAATSLALPMVLDVGVVAENDGIEASLLRKGLYGIDEQEMLRGFEVAMSTPRPATVSGAGGPGSLAGIEKATEAQIVMGVDPRELARSINRAGADNVDLYWYNDARLSHIRKSLEAHTGSGAGGKGDESFAAAVKAAETPEAAMEVIAMHIVKRMSGILMIPVEGFELDGPSLASYGLDSMIGAEMRTWLFKEFGLDYPFQKLLAPTLTFKALAKVIAGKLGVIPEGE
ncbi:hypothetical protein DL762_002044 [Monosporascus cannonballus]|uniref:Carrier domain-containing protein n=1 Tax=Monosporascus cannonballus TaxID=155416 RepID=A0ABY0HJ26_9PEZI|nr:hypothetical protein DL762_002044 [Monosporascus cannonballus]